MTIKELIKELKDVQKRVGNVPVVLSSDEEGNSYSTLNKGSVSYAVDFNNKNRVVGVILYPWTEGFDDPVNACEDN